MTLAEFKALASLHDTRVRMTFSDGEIVVATLLCISTDLDESQRVVYDKVEWSSKDQTADVANQVWYVPGEELISCVAWDVTPTAYL